MVYFLRLRHSEVQSDLKFIVLVVSLEFWIIKILWIKYTCSHILVTGLRIHVDLHLKDKDLFDINFVSYLFIYLLICLFVCLYVFDFPFINIRWVPSGGVENRGRSAA